MWLYALTKGNCGVYTFKELSAQANQDLVSRLDQTEAGQFQTWENIFTELLNFSKQKRKGTEHYFEIKNSRLKLVSSSW